VGGLDTCPATEGDGDGDARAEVCLPLALGELVGRGLNACVEVGLDIWGGAGGGVATGAFVSCVGREGEEEDDAVVGLEPLEELEGRGLNACGEGGLDIWGAGGVAAMRSSATVVCTREGALDEGLERRFKAVEGEGGEGWAFGPSGSGSGSVGACAVQCSGSGEARPTALLW